MDRSHTSESVRFQHWVVFSLNNITGVKGVWKAAVEVVQRRLSAEGC